MSETGVNQRRRLLLITSGLGLVGSAFAATPFVLSMTPSARAKAAGAPVEVDISKLIKFRGVFEPLKDEAFFAKVDVNPEWGTIFWPNGADLDPDVLYSMVTGEAIPEIASVTNK